MNDAFTKERFKRFESNTCSDSLTYGKMLTEYQNHYRMEVTQDNLETNLQVIPLDEIYDYDSEE